MLAVRSMLMISVLTISAVLLAPQHHRSLIPHWVNAGHGLNVMPHEVTIAQWQQCVSAGGCSFMPLPGLGALDDAYPVTGIGILDAQEFVAWAASQTGLPLRLPTREEWHSFSEVSPLKMQRIFTDPRLAWASTYGTERTTDPTLRHPGGFGETSSGIADIKGNVWEWTSTCVVESDADRCPAYFAMGEHEAKIPIFVRDTATGGCSTGTPPAHVGLRLVWTNTPK